MNRVILVTILLSLLIHLLVYIGLYLKWPTAPLVTKPPKPVAVREYELVQHQPPAPRHMEDDPTKANSSDGQAEQKAKRSPSKPTKGKQDGDSEGSELKKMADRADTPSLEAATGERAKGTETEQVSQPSASNMEPLDDDALDEALVESPLDSLEEQKARWHNEVLKRITEQVNKVWVRPDSAPHFSGVARIELDAQGYLTNVYIHLPSGDDALDRSVLSAVRSIWRFDIPQSPLLSRYYRHLTFHYGGES